MVCSVPDEKQHGADGEGVTIRDGKVFTCGDDGKVKFVRPKALGPLPEPDVEAVIIHNQRVLTCSDAGKVKIFDMDLKLIQEFKAHDYAVYDVLVFNNTLFTCCIDSTIKTWDVNTLEHKNTIQKHEEAVRKLCTNGKLVFAGDEKGEVRGYTEDGVLSVWYGVVEEVWGLYAKDDLLFSIRDRGLTIQQVKGEDNKFAHLKSIDGRAPIYAHGEWLVFPDTPGMTLQVFDNNKNTQFALKGEMKGHEMIITAIGGWGDHLLSAGWDSELRLWDLKKLSELSKCKLPDVPNAIAATDQGEIFVVGVGGYICKLKAT
ncbi:hypothetical protein SK128_002599 [Halocaridina rubra]|uniref:Uncharacterized protein n=1 Tax=Halocaridina rubra TaxID=373956 RepID=A0AAN8XBC6_HALRR